MVEMIFNRGMWKLIPLNERMASRSQFLEKEYEELKKIVYIIEDLYNKNNFYPFCYGTLY